MNVKNVPITNFIYTYLHLYKFSISSRDGTISKTQYTMKNSSRLIEFVILIGLF